MRRELFQPTVEGEARLLILIDAFSSGARCLEGRTKLAKLDFLLRYPRFLARALEVRAPHLPPLELNAHDLNDIEGRMIRYRFGPWDPAYYSTLGRLIGKGLITPVPFARGIGYKTTVRGHEVAGSLSRNEAWKGVAERTDLIRRNFDLTGATLVRFIYEHFPEVSGASWGEVL